MMKGSTRVKNKSSSRARRTRFSYFSVAALGLIVTLSLGTVVGPWRDSSGARKVRALFVTPVAPAIPTTGGPSKEYIYAGGKLIATDEPVSGGGPAAPVGLVATTISAPGPLRVQITWTPSEGAHHYQIERTTRLDKPYQVLSSNEITTSFTDTGVASVNAYLYQVRAVDSFGNVSPYSNRDVATAISFIDESLIANSTLVKGQHVRELRQAVSAVMQTAMLPVPSWTDDLASLSGVTVKAIHIEELRSNLNGALSTLGVTVSKYKDPALSGVHIKIIHIEELRQRVK